MGRMIVGEAMKRESTPESVARGAAPSSQNGYVPHVWRRPFVRSLHCPAKSPPMHTKRPTPLRDSPFAYTRPAGQRGWIDRVLGRPRPDLATDALRHLLAKRDPTRISPSDISDLMLEYDVAGIEARSVLMRTWRHVLEAFLSDNTFSDREIDYLDALREAFGLTDGEVEEAERDVVHPRYAIALREALSDARLRDEERANLARLAKQLRLPERVQAEVYERSTRALLEGLL